MKTTRFLGFLSPLFVLLGFVLAPVAAYASVSLSLQSLSPSNSVGVGTNITFTVGASGFTNPTYTLSDSFSSPNGYPTSLTNSSINSSSGYFSWTPNSNDVGTHNVTINVSDSYGNSGSVSEQLIVSSSSGTTSSVPMVEIQGLTPTGTAIVGKGVSFTAAVFGFNSPVFTVSDSFPGSNVSNSSINSSGYFNWLPGTGQIGNHTITVTATDSSGHTASASQQIVVSNSGLTIESITPSTTINTGTPFSFTVVPVGLTNPSYFVNDTYNSTTPVQIGTLNPSTDIFTWTPTSYQSGNHVIVVNATDTLGHTASATTSVYVNQGPSLTLTSPEPNSSAALGATVSFQAFPSAMTSPSFTVSDSFTPYASGENPSLTTVSSGDISSSGSFVWTPTANDLGTHLITVKVTDIYGHTATGSVSIYIAPPSTQTSSAQTASVATAVPTTTTTSATTQTAPASTVTPGFNFTSYLSSGSQGTQVTALQKFLSAVGLYSGPVTGYYGSLTASAVQSFQSAHGIQTLGVVGPSTRNELNLLDSSSGAGASSGASTIAPSDYQFNNPLSVGSSGTDVTHLQDRLTADGFYTGSATGYYGSVTETAVKAYQGAHSLQQLGNVGPATRALLNAGV